MERTIHVIIGGVSFTASDDAFRVLESYLASLEHSLSGDENKAEILKDMEARIAEKLLEAKAAFVTKDAAERVVTEMGAAEDIGDATHGTEATGTRRSPRRLYRDTDDALLGGVASGIAAYLGVDPLLIRLIFLLSILAGGTGILIYIILWILVPAAETAAQKLEMRGDPVNFSNIKREFKDRVHQMRK